MDGRRILMAKEKRVKGRQEGEKSNATGSNKVQDLTIYCPLQKWPVYVKPLAIVDQLSFSTNFNQI
jgi:hypothetical protein